MTEPTKATAEILDDAGELRVGKYRGLPGRVDWPSAGLLGELTRHKRWAFVSLGGPELLAGLAVVDLGYGGSAFLYVWDAREGRFLVEESLLAMPWHRRRVEMLRNAVFSGGGLMIELAGDGSELRARGPGLELRARLRLSGHEPLTVLAPVEGHPGNCTVKRAGIPCEGSLRFEGRDHELRVAGSDWTDGYPPRHTRWRWAMASGWDPEGHPVGFNLVEGFNEAKGVDESAAWRDGVLVGLGPARFRQESDRWRVETTCGGLDLSFESQGCHEEMRNLLLVRSHFRQLVGRFSGCFPWGKGELTGVLEDQDVVW